MAKYDIKDSFWRLDCQEGEKYNFAYVLQETPDQPTKLVVPSSLQMGWVESPPYFCTASKTSQDVATQYIEHPIGTLEDHKFITHAMEGKDVNTAPDKTKIGNLRYFVDVYMDDFIPMAIASSREQL